MSEYSGNLGLKEDLQRLSQLLGELRMRVEKLERTAKAGRDAALAAVGLKELEEETRG